MSWFMPGTTCCPWAAWTAAAWACVAAAAAAVVATAVSAVTAMALPWVSQAVTSMAAWRRVVGVEGLAVRAAG
jgi:hypothetical protein